MKHHEDNIKSLLINIHKLVLTFYLLDEG